MQVTIRGVAKSWARLSDFTFHFHSHEYRNNDLKKKKSITMKLCSNFTSRDIFKGAGKLKRRNQEEKSLSNRKYCLKII